MTAQTPSVGPLLFFLHFAFLLHNPESLFYHKATRVIIFFYMKCVKYVIVLLYIENLFIANNPPGEESYF